MFPFWFSMASSAVKMSSLRILVCWVVYGLVAFRSANAHGGYAKSKATFYVTSHGDGACGYGSFPRTVGREEVAVTSYLYHDGVGCGACYQVRCTYKGLCTEEGVTVLVTDYGQRNGTDFIMSLSAYSKLGLGADNSKLLISQGVVDIEYKRVPCKYPGCNLKIKIVESCQFPDYLAIEFWYKEGLRDILTVGIISEKKNSEPKVQMKRNHGAVWEAQNPPMGPLWLRLLVSSGRSSFQYIETEIPIPANWTPGMLCDSGIQISSSLDG